MMTQQQQEQQSSKGKNVYEDDEEEEEEDRSSNNLYFKGFYRCEIFERLFHRLEYLELWRELAIRPKTIDECDPDDIDLYQNEIDDYNELVKRCDLVRQQMNSNLPPIEKVMDDDLYPQESLIPNAGLGLFYLPSNIQKQQQQKEEDDDEDNTEKNTKSKTTTTTTTTTSKKKFIPEGTTIICYYTGHIHNFQSARSLKDKSYLMALVGKHNYLVDPQPTPQIKARYINDPLNLSLVNCKFVTPSDEELPRSAVVATRNINEGEELFISYGDLYWNQQSIKGNVYTT